ncbi:MAG: hypothetical protein J0L93_08970, partial [Deltaproteobacteria bacterium]|nr:hypothetical protein [Deltaproteobacteria bacterium]
KYLREVATAAEAIRINLYPSYTRKNLHVGILADFLVDARMRAGGLPSNQVVELGGSNGTLGLIIGSGYGFFQDSLQVGVTVKPLYRMGITQYDTQTFNDILQGINPNGKIVDQIFGSDRPARKAFGLGVDVGAKYYLPLWTEIKPSFGVTYQDIANTQFWGSNAPTDIPESISVGVAIEPTWKIFKNTIAIDYRNITKESEILNKIHFGMESVVWNMLAFRVGLSQGYFTGGVGLMTRFFTMDAYVTSQEAARYAHLQPLRSLGLKLAFGF